MNQTQNRNSRLPNGTMLQMGKYRVESCIASGGFGNTYIITNTTFKRRFALKEFFIKGVAERLEDTVTVSVPISDNIPLFDSQKEKFKREAIFLSELNNEHIVHVQDLFEENGTAYYVMDFIEGESLSASMKRTQQPMAEDDVINILRQLLDALRQAHENKILHLDIKPGNIILDKKSRVVLIDFGASKQVDTTGGHTLTTTSLAYTPGYAPTEQITQNKQRIGAWTDIYALGATMYNLLTNLRPPSCDELDDDNALQFPSTVSPNVQQLVRWMMQPSIRKRPQCVDDVTDWLKKQNVIEEAETVQLQQINADEQTEVFKKQPVPVQQPTNAKSEPKTNKKLVMGIVAAAVVTALIVLVSVMVSNKSVEETTLPEAPKEAILQNLINNMVRVDGGTFQMGATSEQGSDAEDWEKPAHQVTVSSFSIGKYEVTQEEWQAVMGSNPSEFKGSKRPVEYVSWDDCQEFILKLNQMTGKNFRLPTEAEWEYAARGGNRSKHYKYAGSNTIESVAWFASNSGDHTHDVGTKSPNELGLYDMSGNVFEWCYDWYGSYPSSSQTNPTGPSSGSFRVFRGGCWGNGYAGFCRVSGRIYNSPDRRNDGLGLRLAL